MDLLSYREDLTHPLLYFPADEGVGRTPGAVRTRPLLARYNFPFDKSPDRDPCLRGLAPLVSLFVYDQKSGTD